MPNEEPPSRTSRRILLFPYLAALLLSIAACKPEDLNEACEVVGICDPSPPAPERVVLICDRSGGASCSPEVLDDAVVFSLEHLVTKPTSTVEVMMLAETLGRTKLVAAFTIKGAARSGLRVVKSHHANQIEQGRRLIAQPTDAYMNDTPAPTRSILIEAIGKVAFSRSDTNRLLHILVISDGREYAPDSGRDFECHVNDSPEELVEAIQAEGILPEGSLANTTVSFAFMRLDEIDGNRCPVDIGAARRLQTIWTSLLTAAGAHSVTFTSGPPDFDQLHVPENEQRGGQR